MSNVNQRERVVYPLVGGKVEIMHPVCVLVYEHIEVSTDSVTLTSESLKH